VRRHAHVLDALAAGELTIGSWRDHGTHVVLLTGELDVATVHRVEDELRAIEATDAAQIILDLSGLTFMDSSGVHLIARAAARCTIRATRLRLRPGPPHVQRLLARAAIACRTDRELSGRQSIHDTGLGGARRGRGRDKMQATRAACGP